MADDIGTWLQKLGLGKYAEAFAENEVDFGALQHLDEQDLRELGLPLGPRKKILAAISALRTTAAAAGDLPAREAERRQLTVMFVDLVGSTGLSSRMDPEEMREVIRRYQSAVSGAVTPYGGHIAKFMGDGVIVYFGYPQAQEDAAERAVRAGLAAVEALAALEPVAGVALACRIGVATGQVVVGDLIGEGAAQEEAVTGETPNLAARLQALAAPGQLLVSQATRALLGGLFEVDDLEPRPVKGFQAPVRAWRIVGARTLESRFEAVRGESVTTLVGREQELALLLDRWQRARDGEGQAVLLSGEAGIGKSRLIRALCQAIADADPLRLSYQCSPYHTNSVLHPFVAQLSRAAAIAEDDAAAIRLDKLETLLRLAADDAKDVAPLFAALLSIPNDGRYAPLELGPRQQMQRTQQALLAQLAGRAGRRPVLVIFEDVHWADPTTLEVLSLMLNRIGDLQVLAIVTHRPEFHLPWSGGGNATTLSLNRLSRRQGEAIVSALAGGRSLPASLVEEIIGKTDGVPLFIEELTKTVLESGIVEAQDGRFVLNGPLRPLEIPSTLHDSLIARLDKLGPAKEMAQSGAAIGREFARRLLAELSPLSEDGLARALTRLVDAGLVFRRGVPPDEVYVFKHALVRDVAYESLLKNRRATLHARIHEALQRAFPHLIETEPELLAHHATLAGDRAAAVDLWLRAGRRAASNSANAEAVSHLHSGLQILAELPDEPARDNRELSYLIALGPALMATVGWDAKEVDRTYSRARELARKTDQAAVLFPAVWGLWLVAHAGGAVVEASRLLRELLDLARHEGDDDIMLQAHHAGGSEMCSEGLFNQARQHIDAGIALYSAERHAEQALRFGGHDPCVCAHSLGALTQLMMGYPDRAERYSQGALDLAQKVRHLPSVAHAGLYRAELCHLLGRPLEVEAQASQALEIAEQFGLAHYAAWSRMLIGWSYCHQGDARRGLGSLNQGLVDLRRVGIRYHLCHRLALRVEALLAAGAISDAVDAAEECLAVVEDTGERWFEPEALRLLARARSGGSAADRGQAYDDLERALATAEELGARFWQLRATLLLARLLQADGRSEEAYPRLARISAAFTEGFDLPDLIEAKALLTGLSKPAAP